ncbi:MAG: SPOR domain-containing protein, partial [Magnetococcales bacterium]|nr:SPOR domain-containing protein [Magnetococcales bacterium]
MTSFEGANPSGGTGRHPRIRSTLVLLVTITVWLAWFPLRAATPEEPAYITNAYFSNKLVAQDNVLRPSAVVSVLPANLPGVSGYFIMDVVLVQAGSHQFQIDILDRNRKKIADMAYDPVQSEGRDHVFTVVGSVAGKFPAGWLFFKVYDQLQGQPRRHISTFYIMTRDPGEIEEGAGDNKTKNPSDTLAQAGIPPVAQDELGNFQLSLEEMVAQELIPAGGSIAPTDPLEEAPAAGASPAPLPGPATERGNRFFIYLGSYGNADNAVHVGRRIKTLGIPIFHENVSVRDKRFLRINAGPFDDLPSARLALKLIEERTGMLGTIHQTSQGQTTALSPDDAPSDAA